MLKRISEQPSLRLIFQTDTREDAKTLALKRIAAEGLDAHWQEGSWIRSGPWSEDRWNEFVDLMDLWEQFSRQRVDEELRITGRTRDLERLQRANAAAAEAHSLEALLEGLSEALSGAGCPDVIQWIVNTPHGGTLLNTTLARPVDEAHLKARAKEAAANAGLALPEEVPFIYFRRSPMYDEGRAPVRRWPHEGKVVIPLVRRGHVTGALAAFREQPWRPSERRNLNSIAALASIHLERIWAVEAAEAGRFRKLLDAMAQAVFHLDSRGHLVHWNQAAEREWAEGPWMPGRPFRLLEGTKASPLLQEVMDGKATHRRSQWEDASGRTIAFTATALAASPVTSGAVVVLEDITERVQLQEQLAQSEKLSSLGQMLSGVAHELNNPLATITGYAQLFESYADLDAKYAEKLKIVRMEADRCRKIVQNLLSFARKRPPESQPFILKEVIKSVVQLLGYQIRTSNVTVKMELHDSLPLAKGDDHQIQQVLVNLMTNALHAVSQQTEERKIFVRTIEPQAGMVGFEIEDSGPGIPEEAQSKIFDPFFTTKEEGKGTGLGLSLVYGIVQSHGGSISVENGKEGGALFRVMVPVNPSTHASAEKADHERNIKPMSPARILVVEDEMPLRNMLREVLESEGHQVASVEDGKAALAALSMETFDLILSDLRMPNMDGKTLVKEMEKKHGELLDRLLLLTGDTLGPEANRFANDRNLTLLRKPFDLEELKNEVRRKLTSCER